MSRTCRAPSGPMRRRLAWGASALLLAPIAFLVGLAALTPLPPELTLRETPGSVRYTDREGALLREVRADDATRARWVPLDEAGGAMARAVVAAEDARFYRHPGVDPLALVRAAATNLWSRRVVSGASTLTMQLARLVRPHRRDLRGKIGEMALALRIEWSLDKRSILEQYLNRAPFGPGLRGVDAASRATFDKPAAELSLAEAAALAGIPRGPGVYSVRRHPERVLRRRDRVLGRMESAGLVTADEARRARVEPMAPRFARGSFGAPHLVGAIQSGAFGDLASDAAAVVTTIDRDLQREAEEAVVASLGALASRGVTSASVLVIDNETGDVLAYVGSPAFFRPGDGQNDGVRAKRQPGSTMKPFVYGLGMERLGWTGATMFADVETRLPVASGVYSPRNYDERFHGPVRLREALASSYNVPAVLAAHELGTARVLDRLHDLGFASLDAPPEHYGPGIALGDGEVTLLELTNAYATLARGGMYRPVRAVTSARKRDGRMAQAKSAEPRRVMEAVAARMLTDVLGDPMARVPSFGRSSALELSFPAAVKTGTSKAYRDNWTVGFTRAVTVGVWVGNFDGASMRGVTGVTGAGPIFHAVMEAAMRDRPRTALAIDGEDGAFRKVRVCTLSGGLPADGCAHAVDEWLPQGGAAPDVCMLHERVAIDRRNGLRAGRGCAPAEVEERTFERYGPELVAWARAARREVAPLGASPLCPGSERVGAVSRVRIGYPLDGARFLVDPDRPRALQTIAVRVEAPPGAARVAVRVDGVPIAEVAAPFVARWTLAKGDHVIAASAADGADAVHVRVD